ncbi:hypothetical protein [Methylobacterium sp. CG08_land_8_20_14_0_20_71_15]|nr:hypothetical protein [Methylobacterium sp. CG08_land_8_20_14_0_20_71_15]
MRTTDVEAFVREVLLLAAPDALNPILARLPTAPPRSSAATG